MVQLGVTQAALHRLGSPPADAHPGEVPDKWLRLAWRLAESGDPGEFPASLRAIELVRDRLDVADPVVCHGDFHPLNVLAAPGGPSAYAGAAAQAGAGLMPAATSKSPGVTRIGALS
jgi:Phosphotransferase enzyme family